MDRQRSAPTLGACVRVEPKGRATFLPKAQAAACGDELEQERRGGGAGDPERPRRPACLTRSSCIRDFQHYLRAEGWLPARLPSPEDPRSGSASPWVSRVRRGVPCWSRGATPVALSSSKCQVQGPAPGGGDHHSGFRAGRRAASPASPVCWTERSGLSLGNFRVRAPVFLLLYYWGAKGEQ